MSEHSESRPKGYKKFSKEGFPRQLFFANAYQFIVADMAGKDLLKNKKKISFEIGVDAPECRWIAPIRAKPEKIYLSQSSNYSAEGNHVPIILNKIFGKTTEKNDSKMLNAINEFGKSSGLFDAIRVKRFGKEASSPFQVNVDLGGSELLVSNVGYGVSQVLPIVLESRRRSGASYISIQQPEVHLHPKAQAALGEFIYDSKKLTGNNFVIETHSDYLIDRFRLRTNKEDCLDAQVLFFSRGESGNKVYSIKINPDGSYPDSQPSQFREFELMRL
jgi:predicted ATPase